MRSERVLSIIETPDGATLALLYDDDAGTFTARRLTTAADRPLSSKDAAAWYRTAQLAGGTLCGVFPRGA